jgi:LysM repeat protein
MSSPAKAYLEPETGGRIECLFNPSELKLSKANKWEPPDATGKNAQSLRFSQGQSGKLSMTLTLDTTATGEPVTRHTGKLLKLMQVDPGLPGSDEARNKGRPPWVRFHWGDFHSFKAVVEKLDLTFTYFASNGDPLRAKASVTLTQYEDDETWPPQNPTSGTPLPHRIHQVQPGETIDRIAAQHLGDPTQWRGLAEANRLDDPLALAPGQALVIPHARAVRRGR